ncbi:hypothetical protein [Bacillus sp. AK128]
MNKTYKIYIQYKVNPIYVKEYESLMEKVIGYLPSFGANQINWYSYEKNIYLESFSVPTASHYMALKKLRNKQRHSIFGLLDQFVEGGLENIQIHAVKVQ